MLKSKKVEENAVYVAVDPSFLGFGVSIIKKNGRIVCSEFSTSEKVTGFVGTIAASRLVVGNFIEWLRKVLEGEGKVHLYVLHELPPPRSIFSAGLFLLNGYMLRALEQFQKEVNCEMAVFSTSSVAIKSFIGSRKATKQDSIDLANMILRSLNSGVTIVTSHNLADSFNLLVYLLTTITGRMEFIDESLTKKFKRPQFFRII